MTEPTPGLYTHYKGGTYRVHSIVHHSESQEELVLYEMLYDTPDYPAGTLWVRPKTMFLESVEIDGGCVPRFVKTSD